MREDRSCCRLLSLLLLSMVLAGCASATPLTSLAGGNTGQIAFQSITLPGTEIILSKEGKPAVAWGTLNFPSAQADRVPAVILVHSCFGAGPVDAEWARQLNDMGIATLRLDSFTGRGIREVCTAQRINTGSMLADAYRALELLTTHPRIDPTRIAIMGFSRGGRIALWASQTRFQRLWNPGSHQFAAYLAFYPSACYVQLFEEEQVSGGPIRIFIGSADDATPVEPCRRYVDRMRRAGRDVVLIEYPGAPHSFDNPMFAPRFFPLYVSAARCTFVEQAPGQFVDETRGALPVLTLHASPSVIPRATMLAPIARPSRT